MLVRHNKLHESRWRLIEGEDLLNPIQEQFGYLIPVLQQELLHIEIHFVLVTQKNH